MTHVFRSKSVQIRLAGALLALAVSATAAVAQYGGGSYGDGQWGRGPDGYADQYHEEQGRPLLGARQGWIAGVAQGQSDRQYGHSFRPTHDGTYKHVPDSPHGYPRDEFKNEYRDAFVKGYAHGYGR